jgi:hypothetical protein
VTWLNTDTYKTLKNFIALFEIGKDEFSDKTLKNLCGGREFIWHLKVIQAAFCLGQT